MGRKLERLSISRFKFLLLHFALPLASYLWPLTPTRKFLYLYCPTMAELKQIAFDFDSAPDPVPEPVKTVVAVAEETSVQPTPKKRGRKPKPPPLVPKQPAKKGRMSLKAAAAEWTEVPDAETLFLKNYYTMGQVADMFHINNSLLRTWANKFSDFLQTKKNRKGDRLFRPQDIKTLEMIHHLIRKRKFTVQGAYDFIAKSKHAEEKFALIQSMQKVKSFLLEIKATL